MTDVRILMALLAGLAVAASGCVDINDPGCTSDDDCRLDRVCSEAGICVSAGGDTPDDDTGNADAGDDTSEEDTVEEDTGDPNTNPINLKSVRIYDDCEGDQHVTRISMSPDPFPACDSVVAQRVDINISSALDLNQQTPGTVEFDRFTGGIQVLGCEGSFCVNASSGVVDLAFYEPGEILDGEYDFRIQQDPEIDDAISGQTFTGRFSELDVNWCSYADEECRF